MGGLRGFIANWIPAFARKSLGSSAFLKSTLAFIAGIVGAFGFAPYYVFTLLAVSFCVLLNLLFKAKSYRAAFMIGWAFGFGYFLAGLYWIAYPLIFYFLDTLWWLVPFAILLIPAILALYHGVCASLLHRFNNGNPVAFSLLFLSLWVLFEILRNSLFTGFPWLIVGYSLADRVELMQSAAWFGVFGLSVVALSAPTVLFLGLCAFRNKNWSKGLIAICTVLVALFATNALYGWYRLNGAEIKLSSHNKIKLIQPNISTLLTRETMDENADKIINLARFNLAEDKGLLYVVLPEGALSYFSGPKLNQLIQRSVPTYGYLIGGGDRVDYSRRLAWNSAFVINSEGSVLNVYDKTHLVPFGEYVPFRKELSVHLNAIVSNFTNDFIDFSRGGGPQTFLPETKFSFTPSICYESLFAKDSINKEKLPNLLINFTTDKWYKTSSGPYQHFDMSRLRAVESGVPMIRAAITGVSGVVDPYGRVLGQLPLNEEGIISSYIPLALETKTFYITYGDTPIILLLVIIVIVAKLCEARRGTGYIHPSSSRMRGSS
jgi:apolipoprotein N-acyltransferase